MNKIFLMLCAVVCGILSSFKLCSDEGVSGDDIREMFAADETRDLRSERMDYQTVAKFHKACIFHETTVDEMATSIISYMKDDISGILLHIAWYSVQRQLSLPVVNRHLTILLYPKEVFQMPGKKITNRQR
ncbi:MAG: hypothetical protein WB791_09365 [Waddliaceae bacterium]